MLREDGRSSEQNERGREMVTVLETKCLRKTRRTGRIHRVFPGH